MERFANVAEFVVESARGILPVFLLGAGRLGIGVSGAKPRVPRARARLRSLLLDCCHFELDRRGKVVNYYSRERAPDRQPPNP